jgi:hypothetical protein
MPRFIACLFALLYVQPALAGPMVHHIEFTLPRAGQQGTTVDVVLQGTHLDEPREVVFYRPGIKAVDIQPARQVKQFSTVHSGYVDQEVHCKFVIAPDCPPGEHPFRVRTAHELSMLSTFWVTPFAVVDEAEPQQGGNDTRDKALPVKRNVTVRGRMDTNRLADVDLYRVAGKAGEHLSVEVTSVWLTEKFYADSEFDLMVRLLDSAGHELARNDDSALHLQDPIVSTVLPKDGDYFVEVRQRIFKGGSNVYYLAHIGNNRRPLAVYPAGGPAGQPLAVKLLGDPAGTYESTVALPSTPGDFDFYDGTPTPLPMRVSTYANVLEHPQAEVTPVATLPSALNGIIEKPGDIDEFRLTVTKGTAYRVRVFARALGTSLDPRISIRATNTSEPNASESEVQADDATHADRDLFGMPQPFHRKELLDPSIVWEPKATGDYLLSVTDMRNLGDPTAVYRIEVEPVHDSIHTYVSAPVIDNVECPRLTGMVVPQGDRWTVNLSIAEGQGNRYKGELEVVARGLPPGVQMIAPHIRPGYKSVPVQFVAAANTPPQAALIELLVKPVDAKRSLESGSHQSFGFLSHSGGRAWHSLSVDRYVLAVVQPPPFSIDVVQPQIPLSQSGELAMQVHVTRHGNFKEAVECQFDWVPAGVQAEPTITIPADQKSATLRLFANSSAQPATWKLAVTASTTGGSYYLGVGRQRVSTSFVDVTIAEPYIALKNKPASVRRGEKSQIVWNVEHKKPFGDEAEAVLLGLPKGVVVVAPAPRLKAGAAQLVFDVAADNEALLGQYKELTCEIVVRQGGQEIRQRTGKGILRVDPALESTSQESR